MNFYIAYGLTIATHLDFPELYKVNPVEKPDVSVHLGEIPEHYTKNTNDQQSEIFITATEYFLRIDSIGSYYASNGNEVIIQPVAEIDLKSVRLFFLSNAMAAILYQRKSIPLHASAIFDGDGIVLFLGDSGVGKSTTVASLQAKGYRVFSDDVCVPVKQGAKMVAFAAYPMMKLWKETFSKVNLGEYQETNRIRPEIDKYGKWFNDSFETEAKQIKKIFVLEKDSIDALQVKPLKGIEAFKHLQNYAYRISYIEEMGLKKDYFDIISTLSNQIPVILITRPNLADTHTQILELIESHLEETQ